MSDRRHLEAVPPEPPDDGGAPTPPNDPTAEQAVLGAMLRDRQTVLEVTELLDAPHFYSPRHELIYTTIRRRMGRLEPIDPHLVADDLRRTGNLNRCGGPAYLHHLYDHGIAVPTDAALHYADILRDLAGRRRLIAAGQRITQLAYTPSDQPLADLHTTALEQLDRDTILTPIPGVDDDTPNHPWAPQDLTNILDHGEELQQPTVLQRSDGHHLLYPTAIHSIAGEPESGKTWVALIAAVQELREGHHVTYVDFEDRAGRVIPRLVNLGATRLQILERFHYIRPITALDPAGGAQLDAVAKLSTLAVIDGVTEAMTLHGLSLMDNEDAARFLDLLPRRLADHGPAVLQIDHVVKDSERQGRWAIGAGHKLAGLDGAAYGVKVIEPFGRGKAGRARITINKDRPGAVREHANGSIVAELVLDSTGNALLARLDEPTTAPRGPDGELRPTHLMEKVSQVVEEHPGTSGRQIEAAVKGKAEYIRLALKTLVIEGFITTENGPRGAVYYHCETPFREDPDATR